MGFLSMVPLAKIIYSAILFGVIVLFASEVYNVWWNHSLYVGQFPYFVDGKTDDNQAKAFPAHILGQHQLLRSALIDERQHRIEERKASAPPNAEVFTGLPSTLPEVARWQTVLSDVELKIQGFDLGKLFTQLRTWISPPDEISGFVEKTGTMVHASVSWPNRAMNNGAVLHSPFDTGQLASDSSVALAIAASIVWAQAANAEPEFARIPREAFVAWVLTWWEYRQIRGRQGLGDALTDEDKKRWTQARRLVDKLIGQAEKYPEIWRLRADIIDAAVGDLTNDNDKKIAAEDRGRYAAAARLTRVAAPAQPTVASLAIASTVHPGLTIWARPANAAGDHFDSAVTVTAIVTDAAGNRKIVLPAYIIAPTADGATEFAMSAGGTVVARASKADIVYPEGSSDVIAGGVALASLESGATADNTLAIIGPLTTVASAPNNGDQIKLFSSKKQTFTTAQVSQVEPPFIVTPRITEPGDGGAPVLSSSNGLVAMGYLGTEADSRLLLLDWLFQKHDLKLVQRSG